MPVIRSGRLRHKLDIQEATETRDADGGSVVTYSTKRTIWGDVRPIEGDEFLNARGQVIATITHKIVTRYYPDITTLDRIVFDTRVFGIFSVLNVEERNKMLQFNCREIVAGASSS